MEHTTTISSKGQITLPVQFRRSLNLKTGDRLTVNKKGNVITVKPDNYEEELARLRKEAQSHLQKKGFTKQKLRQMAEQYQSGGGWAAHVKEKYGGSN